MSEPFVGEIRIFATSWAPQGWYPCDGSALPIMQYEMLYAVIGRTYTLNTTSSNEFNLPNFNSGHVCRAPIAAGNSPSLGIPYNLGQQVGVETVTLTENTLPRHNHDMNGVLGKGADTVRSPADNSISRYLPAPPELVYAPASGPNQVMDSVLAAFGKGRAHENRQPNLALSFFIAWDGIYPVPE